MFCQYCGGEIKEYQKYCINCGALAQNNGTNSGTGSTNPSNANDYIVEGGNKGLAVVAYLSWIGFLIALILNNEQKDEFAQFHLNQALILNILGLLTMVPYIGKFVGMFHIVLWIIGIVYAAQGKRKELPIVGQIKII